MSWIDAGVNLLDPRLNNDEILIRSKTASVTHLVAIASTLEESESAIKLKSTLTSSLKIGNETVDTPSIAVTAGVHPHYADQYTSETFSKLKYLCTHNKVAAIGECGLDFNRNFSTQENQLRAFESQLELAAELKMGVYLHQRDAFEIQVKLLNRYKDAIPFMVAHCFTGNKEQLNTYLELCCYIGITGWLCDEKRGQELRDAALDLPLNRLLMETDAPYLFPKTLKPKKRTNEPSFLPHIAQTLADIKQIDISEIETHSYQNAYTLFF